ncbi:hypothetical protein EVB94_328 [Rhizobium phage RHph_TM40]|uniref:Uncharacterized protein n=2 Tax=Cuauhnahuacvirus TaxID=3044696 RepID=A0A7S5RDQ8_9CAUD|nr:hypothetical protein PQC16_gp333 [Rhizobium phage RHph_TM30]YP_010671456.1 hypothetical protein PQC17_gp334 [Rhizobium phage RHph_Y65]QIG71779.1 hypothetical protein EVB94_328 [Rhizobium phage RHph_TM40]QIG72140.1 hypothetical protein EVB95_326 [Rhizobium phage RHph_TM2_3B]QIG72502.1 hypothetical protein EVB96_326 [Rhizobium phage RHph_TM3_3_6]QIG77564.1 hypothetical protein EVB61_258 [Rhizobium phage RHph_TM21B]QIG77892.1 hypothetical protein EVB64_326 [Rhizobium phage RHph_TM61]
MQDLSQLCEVEMEKLVEILMRSTHLTLDGVELSRSHEYHNSPSVSTIKTHKVLDDSYITVRLKYV